MSVTTGITSPEGLTTAFDIVESSDVTAQTHELAQTGFSVVSGTAYTFSLFIKAGTNNRNLRLAVGGANFVGSPVATFNPVSGSVVASGDCVASVENYGNGWFRCRMTATADVAGSSFLGIYTASGTSVSYIGNGSGSVQVWGAQAEASSIPTSYIPTTAAAVTRNAEVINLSGAVSGCIGQTEGTMYWEGAINRFDRVFFTLASGTSTTQCVRLQTTGAGLIQGVVLSGTAQCIVATLAAVTLGQFYKVAFAYKENDFVLYLNGVQQNTDTSGTLPTNLNSMYLLNSNGTEITDQRCRAAALYTTRLTNAELAALTT
jgi:hypothetical protein